MRTLPSSLVSFVLLAASATCSCTRQDDESSADIPSADKLEIAAATAPIVPYPLARWRLVDPRELNDVVLWVSHIVIRHRDAASFDPCFSAADWHSTPARGTTRDRLEALALARGVAATARSAPDQFAWLALEYSDDDATRDLGGSLGGLPASQLINFDEVLDALAATPIGSTTDVVETRYGFHVFYRRLPPPKQIVTGRHLVIGHESAGWLKVVGRDDMAPPTRSRDDALALATRVYAEANARPSDFEHLIARYSEHRDALRGGDMGTWSNDEPVPTPRQIEVLENLAPGDIAPPLDSPVGYQILQRVAEPARINYATQVVRLGFNPEAPDEDATSRRSVLATATRLAATLQKRPELFDRLSREYCCETTERWTDGRGSPPLTSALEQLSDRQITPNPVRDAFSFMILKKLAPEAIEKRTTRHDLPSPEAPDVAYLISHYAGDFPLRQLESIAIRARAELALDETDATPLMLLHRAEGQFNPSASPAERNASYRKLLADVQRLLGAERYQRYVAIVNSHFEALLLDRSGI
jgi:hypothetical protein